MRPRPRSAVDFGVAAWDAIRVNAWPRFSALLLAAGFLMSITACATREDAPRSTNDQTLDLPPVALADLTASTEAAMERRGFLTAPAFLPGSSVLRKPGRILLRFIKGGQGEVWFIAEPTASGWHLVVVPRPDQLNPGGAAPRFDGALREISRKLSQLPASTGASP